MNGGTGSLIGTTIGLFILVQVMCLDEASEVNAFRYLSNVGSSPDPLLDAYVNGLESSSTTIDQLSMLVEEGNLLKSKQNQDENFAQEEGEETSRNKNKTASGDRKLFAVELLRLLHDQYGKMPDKATSGNNKSRNDNVISNRQQQAVMSQLLTAIGADGDMRRLIDWIQNSFNLATVGEVTTQFVVSKLGSVNCAALLRPDSEETLIPRFLLFNEHFVDVPFELPINPKTNDCINNGKFDPSKKTVLLLHGYLSGYTMVDGLTNIKNRILDLNNRVEEQAMRVFEEVSRSNGTYLLTEDLHLKVKQQQYNVIIVDWFNGANPIPRSRYIRAAVNSQVVGKLIARFLSALIVQCKTPSSSLQIIGHSLGCHVAGFAGKAMRSIGQQIGKITHLDPVGLCFGRLFSQPQFRLSPNDAIETQAVHVSLNIFDNPLDGAQSNFLVNGGRDQIGCGGQSELKNSTSSSAALLYDSDAEFKPCSHLRALSLYEDDLSSEPDQCQIVGYRCASYERFLAGKCGRCDEQNNQCRLMSLPPIVAQFKRLNIGQSIPKNFINNKLKLPNMSNYKLEDQTGPNEPVVSILNPIENVYAKDGREKQELRDSNKMLHNIANNIENNNNKPDYGPEMYNNNIVGSSTQPVSFDDDSEDGKGDLESKSTNAKGERSGLLMESSQKLVKTISKLRDETRSVLSEGFSRLSGSHRLSLPRLNNNNNNQKDTREEHWETIKRFDPVPVPVGSQAIPDGSVNSPLYFVGTGPVSPYCVNYYQFRMLIAEARARKILNSLANGNRLSQDISAHGRDDAIGVQKRLASNKRDQLHMTVKLTDTQGHFFKGFTLLEDARNLVRIPTESLGQRIISNSENMIEISMLLNTTKLEPVRISESIVSFYFHGIVLADSIEINYMSNISPEIRNRYSSVLCPVAINDKHQLVRYIECDKVGA